MSYPKAITITVPSSKAVSTVWVGGGILSDLTAFLETARYSQVLVIGDRGADTAVNQVKQALGVHCDRSLYMEGGEACKSVPFLTQLWDFFSSSQLDRKGLVVCVGGGALSDLVGFAASSYMRGVSFAVIPTTLLAQVDAGMGGKSGINFNGVKNLIGAVAQPVGIIVDVLALKSLPKHAMRSGFAEIIKHGLIFDKNYFNHVTSRNYTEWEDDSLLDIVFRSCQIKSSIVEQDPLEQGMRRALNFGHTLGHAVEAHSLSTPTPLSHGEAVSIGINAACFISHRLGLLNDSDWQDCILGLTAAGLPLTMPTPVEPEQLINFLALDKKNIGGTIRWTLLSAIGSVIIDQQVPLEVVREAISHIQPTQS